MQKATNLQSKSSRKPCEWNLLDSRDLLRQKQGEKTEHMPPKKTEAKTTEATMSDTTKPATLPTKAVSAYGNPLGRKPVSWAERPENAIPAKLLAELNEKIAEKRLESKKRKRRAPDDEIKAVMEVVLDKNYGNDTGVATSATMEIKAEIGRRLVAQRTANVEKQNRDPSWIFRRMRPST